MYRALFIDVGKRSYWIEEFSLNTILGPITLGIKIHTERYESWSKPVYHPDNVLVIGAGILAGSRLYGVHRLIAVFRSPLTKGLHVSAMGGSAYQFKVNADALVLVGKSLVPLIVKVYDNGDGNPVVEFYEIGEEELINIWKDYKGLKGSYALQEYLSDRFKEFYEEFNGRSILTGPASMFTNMGALISFTLFKGKIDYGSEDFAARGGGGSVMVKAHNVVALIYGGRYRRSDKLPTELTNTAFLDDISIKHLGQSYVQAVISSGVKYRYDPKLNTGGTFGGNYPTLRLTTPMFNWNMIYCDKSVRGKLYEMIMKNMWEIFNKEAIETKSWKTCGEPCPLACKKVRLGRYKTDYEPYNGLGPMIGVFHIHDIEKIVELTDTYGFDAIELGQVIGFVFEAIQKELLKPEEVGLSAKPFFHPVEYKMDYSKHNAELAIRLIEQLAFGSNSILRLIGEKGLRSAAKILDIMYRERVIERKTRFVDIPIYAVFGEEGHITPNYYWTPGLVAPLPILGKYWTLYSGIFTDPEDFAKRAFERAIYEFMIEDLGICRFHRGWAEKIVPHILEKVYGIEKPLEVYKRSYRELVRYQKLAGAMPVFWDSGKIIDLMMSAAIEYGNTAWSEWFKEDKQRAAYEWWTRFYNTLSELVGKTQG
ncbi:MAG: aldehyde ferredoxin oxidoreductase N-terminal domain-containing protein [Desulfurococcaceae archaeon]